MKQLPAHKPTTDGIKFGIKSPCNHPAFKAEGDDRTTIMTSTNWKKKQVMLAAIQKTAKNLLESIKNRAKNTLAM